MRILALLKTRFQQVCQLFKSSSTLPDALCSVMHTFNPISDGRTVRTLMLSAPLWPLITLSIHSLHGGRRNSCDSSTLRAMTKLYGTLCENYWKIREFSCLPCWHTVVKKGVFAPSLMPVIALSPAGLSSVNGDDAYSAKMVNFNPHVKFKIMNFLILNRRRCEVANV